MITGQVLSTEEKTVNGQANIAIHVEFSDDKNVIVPDWILWARFDNFIGLTSEEIIDWITINIQHQIGNLIIEKTKSGLNQEFVTAIEQLKGSLIKQTDTIQIPIENAVASESYTVTLKEDGTYTTDRPGEVG